MLYSPAVIATYSIVGGLPLGCLLYGINVARRGSRVVGTALWIVAALSYLFTLAAAALGASIAPYGILGILGAIGFYQTESGPFERALRKGGRAARRWPPALFALGALLLMAVAVAIALRGSYAGPEGAN